MKKYLDSDWKILTAALVLSVCLHIPSPAAALPQKEAATEIGPLTVTAQKKEENQKDVPISMTALSALTLEDRQIKSILDIGPYSPNLMMFENGVSGMISPSFRGLTSDIEARAVPSGMYIDGVPVLAGIGFDEPLMDVERVEILRGPQGTLYGKNTEAGVINVITRQPGNAFFFKTGLELGQNNKREVTLSMSTPLVKDKFFMGISAKHYEKDGFIHNTLTGRIVDDRKHDFGKLNFRFTPNPDLEISWISSLLQYDDGDAAMNMAGTPDRSVSSDLEGYNKSQSAMSVVTIKYDLSAQSRLESISAFRRYDIDTRQDWDFNSTEGNHVDRKGKNTTLSQELRFHSEFGQRFTYTTGLYLEKNDDQLRIDSTYMENATDFLNSSLGLFTHGNFQLTETLSLNGGLRYDREDKEMKNTAMGIDESRAFSAFSPKLGLKYDFAPNGAVWASISKGYRAGGFSTFIVNNQAHSFEEESLISYEIGMKHSFFNDKFFLTTSAYFMDISDMQVQQPLSPDMEITTNAAQASAKGVEIELSIHPTRGLTLFSGAGYNDTRFERFSDAGGDYQNNNVPFAPKYNFNIGGKYRTTSGLFARLDITGYGDMYFDKANLYKRDNFALVNTKVGYEGEHFDAYVYAKNLFDTNYDSNGYYNGYYTIYSPPREIGVQLACRF